MSFLKKAMWISMKLVYVSRIAHILSQQIAIGLESVPIEKGEVIKHSFLGKKSLRLDKDMPITYMFVSYYVHHGFKSQY